jgi:hypothetical protein
VSVKEYPICPRCEHAVKKDGHELRLQLVNAANGAPRDAVDLHAIFHHGCASGVWNAAREAWFPALDGKEEK